MNSKAHPFLCLLGNLLILAVAQDGSLPDSVSNTDCLTLQMNSPSITCDSTTGDFSPIQCNNGLCMCVDITTGAPISGFTFPENSENINCDFIFVSPEAAATTDVVPGLTTDDPDDEDSDSSESSNSEETSFSDSDTSDTDFSGENGTTSGRSRMSKTNGIEDSDTESSDSRSKSRCPSVRKLLAKGCTQSCILEDSGGCPACNRTCLDLADDYLSLPGPTACSCDENQVFLRVGRFGDPRCVDLLTEGERCDSNEDDDTVGSGDDKDEESVSDFDETSPENLARRRVGGARDRFFYDDLSGASVGCQEGLVCAPAGFGRSECQPENPNGTCVIARQEGVDYDCAPDGSFEPLQCQPDGDNLHCACVQPSDGSPIVNTQVIIEYDDTEEVPNCEQFVGCTVERAGQTFNVAHGDYLADVDNCQRCLCNNGKATFCEPSVCTGLQQSPPQCTYQGQSYNHGESFMVDCNMCGCRNGELRCTRQQCENTALRDLCQECLSQPKELVCGINGVTYPSACVAQYCAGMAPFHIFPGNCSSVDFCMLYPCGDGERCIRRGGATCFDANGCDPDDLRLCVDLESLICEDNIVPDQDHESNVNDPEIENAPAVCGTNGVTYPSLCHLLQDTGNEVVAYAGRCGQEECQGGLVCGTDGVTYENMCVLRAQSANARVDFLGECEEQKGSPNEYCTRVSRARRCIFNSSTCRHLIRPEEGCCALCGGIIFVAIDFAGLHDYVRINPRARTLDAFLEILIESGFIDEEIIERCEVEGTLTRTGNIQLSLSVSIDEDSEFCNDASGRLAAAINDPSSVSDDPRFARIPEILQFASAAVAAPNSNAVTIVNEVDVGMNGGPAIIASSFLSLFAVLVTLIFAYLKS